MKKPLSLITGVIVLVVACAVGIAYAATSNAETPTQIGVGGPLNATVVGHMTIDGIQGGDPASADIDVRSFKVGVAGTVFNQGNGSGVSSRGRYGDFNVVKSVDAASPALARASLMGTHIRTVTVAILRPKTPAGQKQDYLVYKLDNVLITSIQNHDGGTEEGTPLEELTFNFGAITETYTPTTGAAVSQGWDTVRNRAL